MNTGDDLLREALDLGAEYRPTTDVDWAEFQRRIQRGTPSRHRPSSRWMLPVAVVVAASAVIVAAVVGRDLGRTAPVSAVASHMAVASDTVPASPHRAASGEATQSASTSPAPRAATVTCTIRDVLTDAHSVPVAAPPSVSVPGTARIGYESAPSAGDTPTQCLLISENGRTLAGRTNGDPGRVLQYTGEVTGADGTYQFASATDVATSIRIVRDDGSTTTLIAKDLTRLPTGFVVAVIYTRAGGSPISSATAYDVNNRLLNALPMP